MNAGLLKCMGKSDLDIKRTHRSIRQLDPKSRSDPVVVRRPRGSSPEIPLREEEISTSNGQVRALIGEVGPMELEVIRRLAYKARLTIGARFTNGPDPKIAECGTNPPMEPVRGASSG